jgi:hypothetical protein
MLMVQITRAAATRVTSTVSGMAAASQLQPSTADPPPRSELEHRASEVLAAAGACSRQLIASTQVAAQASSTADGSSDEESTRRPADAGEQGAVPTVQQPEAVQAQELMDAAGTGAQGADAAAGSMSAHKAAEAAGGAAHAQSPKAQQHVRMSRRRCSSCSARLPCKIRTCDRCGTATYCSKECQAGHWLAGHARCCIGAERRC